MKNKNYAALLLAAAMLLGSCGKTQENKESAGAGNTFDAFKTAATTASAESESTVTSETTTTAVESAEATSAPETEAPAAAAGPVSIADLTSTINAGNCADYDLTSRAMEYLTKIGTDFKVRNIDGEDSDNKHDDFIDWLKSELQKSGYPAESIEEKPFTVEYYPKDISGRNIVLTVPGADESRQIIVGAHFDGDGVSDNGSGVALLMAAADKLVGTKPQYTVKFIFFDGEEKGLLGSSDYSGNMTKEEVDSTLYMVNIDAVLFGDFCNINGGVYGEDYLANGFFPTEDGSVPEVRQTEGYDFAADVAESLGYKVYRTKDLDGVFDGKKGKDVEANAFFTNPWTKDNPAPENMIAPSPATIPVSDHAGFADRGIPYISFESVNWWAGKPGSELAYTGYIETYDLSLGEDGMFMNTEYDTLENVTTIFPSRAEEHFKMYSELLSALILVERK